jgi:hypothetical protein
VMTASAKAMRSTRNLTRVSRDGGVVSGIRRE